jgi:PAS domain S-box-containing protein
MREDGVFLARSRATAGTVGRRLKPDSPALALMRAGREGDLRTIGSLGGRDIFSAVRRVPGSPLYVSANIGAALATAGVDRLRAGLRAGEVALALLGFGAVWLVHQWQQRRRGVAALAAAEATRRELARVLEGLPGAAFRGEVEPDGAFRFLYGSPAISEMTGMRRSELQTLDDWARQIEAEDPPGRVTDLPLRAARRGSATADLLFRRPDGTRRWLRATLKAVRETATGKVELIGYTSDVTEPREALSAAINASKLATLGEMATGLAHELNQPVSIMALAAENAGRALNRRGAAAIPDALQRMERIGQLAQRAKGIIDHLRAFGRTDPGALEPVSLAAALAGARMLTDAALREAEVALAIDLPADLPPVRGRSLLLEQVLINLLLNARDAMLSAGTPERRITLAARVVEAQVVVTVTDTGPGIPEAVLPRLFEPFYTTKPTGQGTGLGLSLCHGIMRSFGGAITAGNAPQGGAAFRLVLLPEAADVAAGHAVTVGQ